MDRIIMLGTNYRIRANEEEGACYVEMYDTATGQWVQLLKIDSETITDIKGVKLSGHGSEHGEGGTDPITGISYTQLSQNTIELWIPYPIPDSVQSGLDTSSTGVKWTSNFKVRWNKKHIKKVAIAANISNPGAANIKIALRDDNTGNDIVALTYTGTEGESMVETADLTNMSTNGPGTVYAEVTATGTASFDINYVTIYFEVGIA